MNEHQTLDAQSMNLYFLSSNHPQFQLRTDPTCNMWIQSSTQRPPVRNHHKCEFQLAFWSLVKQLAFHTLFYAHPNSLGLIRSMRWEIMLADSSSIPQLPATSQLHHRHQMVMATDHTSYLRTQFWV